MKATTKTRLNITDGLSGQFRIDSAPYDGPGTWGERYINFSGYFGSIGPHVFAAAPDYKSARDSIFDAIKHGDDEHKNWLKRAIDDHFAEADAKAKGGAS